MTDSFTGRIVLTITLIAALLAAPAVSVATCGVDCSAHLAPRTGVQRAAPKAGSGCCGERSCDAAEAPASEDDDGCCDVCAYCCMAHAQVFVSASGWSASTLAMDLAGSDVKSVDSVDAIHQLLRPPLR